MINRPVDESWLVSLFWMLGRAWLIAAVLKAVER